VYIIKYKIIIKYIKYYYEKLQKFEENFELVSRNVKLNILTRKSTDKNTT
jgi:hypothetical protein